MKKYVLDSFALLAYAENEKGSEIVADILIGAIENKNECFMTVVNFGEMYYIALREGGNERAELYRKTILQFPITIVNADMELTLTAAKYKAHYKMSYADAFAAGLAEQKKAILVTGDEEFDACKKEIKIIWI
jgi:predicted nucleic acid-binding protein